MAGDSRCYGKIALDPFMVVAASLMLGFQPPLAEVAPVADGDPPGKA